MGINDRDYMRRRPEESKLSEAKSSFTNFIQRNPVVATIIAIVILAILWNLWKG